ncbi:hypothetical protein PCI56_18700 [Plesiomonas shigelloides subsp. oncorhynchi]|nr:hypothetical protein [Plesiomonas shigelloides]
MRTTLPSTASSAVSTTPTDSPVDDNPLHSLAQQYLDFYAMSAN